MKSAHQGSGTVAGFPFVTDRWSLSRIRPSKFHETVIGKQTFCFRNRHCSWTLMGGFHLMILVSLSDRTLNYTFSKVAFLYFWGWFFKTWVPVISIFTVLWDLQVRQCRPFGFLGPVRVRAAWRALIIFDYSLRKHQVKINNRSRKHLKTNSLFVTNEKTRSSIFQKPNWER